MAQHVELWLSMLNYGSACCQHVELWLSMLNVLLCRPFISTLLRTRHSVWSLKVCHFSLLNLSCTCACPFCCVLSFCCCSATCQPGEKFLTRWYRGYLISVSFGGRVVGSRASTLSTSQGGPNETMTLTIYDIQNQFVGKGSPQTRHSQSYISTSATE